MGKGLNVAEPLPYERVANDLRMKIGSGVLAPGTPLPSNHTLMAEFGVSTSTVQRAIRVLKSDGLVETRLGKGVFVRERRRLVSRSASYLAPSDNAEKALYRGKSKNIEVREVEPPDDIAEALGLDVGEAACLRSRAIVIDDELVEIVISYFPADLAKGTALSRPTQIRGGTMAELARLGVPPRRCIEMVQTRMPSADEARLLKLGPGTPVFRLVRTLFTEDGRPVEVLDMILPSDRYQLRYELPIHD